MKQLVELGLVLTDDSFGGPSLSSSTISGWLKAVNRLRSRTTVNADAPSSFMRVQAAMCESLERVLTKWLSEKEANDGVITQRLSDWRRL